MDYFFVEQVILISELAWFTPTAKHKQTPTLENQHADED